MTTTSPPVRLLSIVAAGARHDVAVPAGLSLADLVLQAGGRPDDAGLQVSTAGGRPLPLAGTVGELLVDGDTVLIDTVLIDTVLSDTSLIETATPDDAAPANSTAPANGTAPANSTGLAHALTDHPVPAGVALAAAGLLAVTLAGMLARLPAALTGSGRMVIAGLAAVAAVMVAAGSVRARPELCQAVAGLLAFAAGFGAVPTDFTGHLELAVTTGALAAAVVLALARPHWPDRDEVASVLLVAAVAVTVAFGLALMAAGSARVPAAVLLGLLPGVLRVLPAYSLDVPDEQLIDVDRLAVTAWAGPPPRRTPNRRLRLEDVRRTVAGAQRTVSAATVTVSALAVLLAGMVLAGTVTAGTATPTARWAGAAVVALVVLAFGLQPRSARSLVDKLAPRATAALLLGELAVAAAGWHSAAGSLLAAGGLLVLGLTAIGAATALGAGWLSVRLSRLADGLESVAVLLALPVALVAVETIATFRQLTSG